MKYYSEVLNKLFNSEEELNKAEVAKREEEAAKAIAEKNKKEARAKRAKEVEEALKAANEAQSKAIKLLKEFTKDFGYYHTSYSVKDDVNTDFDDFFDILHTFLH